MRSVPPATSARAAMTPPTIAAADEPRPRPCGIRLAQTTSNPRGRPPSRLNASYIALTTRLRALRATLAAPMPATSTVRPGSSVTRTTMSSYSESARPSASNPGPRFALVAGTRTRTGAARNVDFSFAIGSATQSECCGGGLDVGRDRLRSGRTGDRPLRVLQPVARDSADHTQTAGQSPLRMRLQQSGDTRRTRGFDKDALLARDAAVGLEDQLVRHRLDGALGLISGGKGLLPGRGVADADRGGDRRWVGDRGPGDDRRGAGGLEPAHHRCFRTQA